MAQFKKDEGKDIIIFNLKIYKLEITTQEKCAKYQHTLCMPDIQTI